MSDYAAILEWARQQQADGYVFAGHTTCGGIFPKWKDGEFVAISADSKVRLYLYRETAGYQTALKGGYVKAGWPPPYGATASVSTKIDYAKITREIIGR